jgi:hypothetical protein
MLAVASAFDSFGADESDPPSMRKLGDLYETAGCALGGFI